MILKDEDKQAKTKILNVIMDDPEIVLLIKERYVDEEIWRYCIEMEPSLFKKMKHPSESLCLYACEIDGSNLRYIRNKFNYVPITKTMVVTAVRSNPKAILYVPDKFLDESLKEMAFDKDPSLMAHFDFIRPEYLEENMKEKPYIIQYLNKYDDDMICEAIKANPNICSYLNYMTKKMMQTLETYYPNHYQLYKNSFKND